jgi:hypothetical protein
MKFANRQIEELPLANLTVPQFLAVGIETTKALGWVFGDINTTGFIAYTNNGFPAWNAEVRVKISNGIAVLQCQSSGSDVTHARENKRILQSFISTFNSLKGTLVFQNPATEYEKIRSDFSSN